MPFTDRGEAGKLLAEKLKQHTGKKDRVILAIPRGGLVIGRILADRLRLPLGIILTKKIGHPYNPEYAIGAVSMSGRMIDERAIAIEGIPMQYINEESERLRKKLKERYERYSAGMQPTVLRDKIVIITDDGIATGSTIRAAISLAREGGAKEIIVAVPVCPKEVIDSIAKLADEVICLEIPESFSAIGQFYESFEQVEDEEAIRLLHGSDKKNHQKKISRNKTGRSAR